VSATAAFVFGKSFEEICLKI